MTDLVTNFTPFLRRTPEGLSTGSEILFGVSFLVNEMKQKIDPEFDHQTTLFWSNRNEKQLNASEKKEIVTNLTGFFSVLAEWDSRSSVNKRGL